MLYRRPVLRPVRCSTRKESSSTPCSGEPRSIRTSGLPILTRAGGGTERFTVPVIAQHLPPITMPGASRCARDFGHLIQANMRPATTPGRPVIWTGRLLRRGLPAGAAFVTAKPVGRVLTPMWHQGARARHAGGHGPPFAGNALLKYVRCPTLQQWQNRLSDSHRSRSIQVGGCVSLLH